MSIATVQRVVAVAMAAVMADQGCSADDAHMLLSMSLSHGHVAARRGIRMVRSTLTSAGRMVLDGYSN